MQQNGHELISYSCISSANISRQQQKEFFTITTRKLKKISSIHGSKLVHIYHYDSEIVTKLLKVVQIFKVSKRNNIKLSVSQL